jgi:hypothetical protein
MRTKQRTCRRASLAMGVVAFLATQAASALDDVIDEIVVYGTQTALVLDTASLRIDVKQSARALGRSVSDALAAKVREPRVAAAEPRPRG